MNQSDSGLDQEEYAQIVRLLGRDPNPLELGIFSVMWSEHCSYKSSRVWLRRLPGDGPGVVCGPGENAGVVDIGGGLVAVFKMESHNHPSFIEPYQGAATGVGGIMRDVFTMGARPVALLNSLCFGSPDHARTRHLLSGVVSGIGGYGNCIGVPTVAGRTAFDSGYNGNILVNAMCVGVAPRDRIFYSAAAGIGNPVYYVGSRTGRDGIHGATMASASFGGDADAKRPTVQVGDPFTEKLLLEACLELMAGDAIVAIQDMGAAGLTSSSVEMAGRGGVGMALNLDRVPCRETGMTPEEIMLSESQERMLMVVDPSRVAQAREVFEKWELSCVPIGEITDTGRIVLTAGGEVCADIPLPALVDEAPCHERPWTPTPPPPDLPQRPESESVDIIKALLQLVGGPHGSSRRWVWEQYDHTVMGDSVQGPGGDAAVVRLHGTDRGLAVCVDMTPRYVSADPFSGGRQAVAEVWRNLSAVGSRPLAITDCLNFGNPERPEVMGQFAGAIEGIAEACVALEMPVVSGNVSFYNETGETAIPPSPAIGGVGLLEDIHATATTGFKNSGEAIVRIGESRGHLGRSLYLKVCEGREEGSPPPVDLDAERRNGDFIRAEITAGRVSAVHDISDGGLAVCLAEMAMAGGIGAEIELPDSPEAADAVGVLFGEDQAGYVLTCPAGSSVALLERAAGLGIPAAVLGQTGGERLTLGEHGSISLSEMRATHEGWFEAFMTGAAREA